MLDRAEAEAVIYRTAVAAFSWYPTKHQEEPGYSIQEDIDWCVEPLGDLFLPHRRGLSDRIRQLITDPTADRRSFVRDLMALTTD